jgi:hypothetical protein
MHQFRYSRSRFLTMMFASLALTAAITFTVYVLLSTFGIRQARMITYATGLIFFAFLSAGMIYQFLRKQVVLSIHQGGIVDRRYSREVIAWDNIRSINIELVEQEVHLRVNMWPQPGGQKPPGALPFIIDLSLLDADTATIISSIERYCPINQSRPEEWQ